MTRRFFTMLLFTAFFGLATQQQAGAQILSTKLKITVIDPIGNVVPDAEVILFKTKADYQKEVNPVQKLKLTNVKGQVTFKKLEPRSYYVLVRKGDMSNAGGGEIVNDLVKGKVNKANVVISDGL